MMAIVQLERREFVLSGQEKRGTVPPFFPHPTGQKLVTRPLPASTDIGEWTPVHAPRHPVNRECFLTKGVC